MSNTAKLIKKCAEYQLLTEFDIGKVVDETLFLELKERLLDWVIEDIFWYGEPAGKELEECYALEFDKPETIDKVD